MDKIDIFQTGIFDTDIIDINILALVKISDESINIMAVLGVAS